MANGYQVFCSRDRKLMIDRDGANLDRIRTQNISAMGSPRHRPAARALCQATRE